MFSFIIILLVCFLPVVSATPCDHLLDLPDEMIWLIVFNLDIRSLKAIVCASKVLAHIIHANSILPLYLKGACIPKKDTLKGTPKFQAIHLRYLAPTFKFPRMSGITFVDLRGCDMLTCLKDLNLDKLPHLDTLCCNDLEYLSTVDGLEKCKRLTKLWLNRCSAIKDLSCIGGCKMLRCLYISSCYLVKDLSFLGNCTKLHELNMAICCQIQDISFLAQCPELYYLDISLCNKIDDIKCLENCKFLKEIYMLFLEFNHSLDFLPSRCKIKQEVSNA